MTADKAADAVAGLNPPTKELNTFGLRRPQTAFRRFGQADIHPVDFQRAVGHRSRAGDHRGRADFPHPDDPKKDGWHPRIERGGLGS